MLYLFTLPSCSSCHTAKKLIEEKSLATVFIDASKPEGVHLARKYQVMHVPTLLKTDADENLIFCASGIEEITAYLDTPCSLPAFKN